MSASSAANLLSPTTSWPLPQDAERLPLPILGPHGASNASTGVLNQVLRAPWPKVARHCQLRTVATPYR